MLATLLLYCAIIYAQPNLLSSQWAYQTHYGSRHSVKRGDHGTNVSTNYITCPADPKKTLGIKLPFLVHDACDHQKRKFLFYSDVDVLVSKTKCNAFSIFRFFDFHFSWRSTSHSKFKFWMTKMFVGDSVLRIIRLLSVSWPVLTFLFFQSTTRVKPFIVQCLWGSMRAGIRFSSTSMISPVVFTERTTLKRYV